MIAKNYIRYPEALRFQCEMFSNGYHNSPRIMRLMTVIFDWTPTAPDWVKDAKARAAQIVKAWKHCQMELFATMKKKARNTWTQLALVLFPDAPEQATVKTAPALVCAPKFRPKMKSETKYKLDKARDVDTDEPGVYILNLPAGFRFDDGGGFNPKDSSHVQGFDSMRELKDAIKNEVIECYCNECLSMLKKSMPSMSNNKTFQDPEKPINAKADQGEEQDL